MSKRQLILMGVVVVLLLGAAGAWYVMGGGGGNVVDAASAAAGAAPAADKITADDKVMGSPNAPVTMIEYFAQDCSACAHFDQAVFPALKAKYIDTGKVRYVMRLYPIFPLDGPSYKLDLCVPPDQFFHAVDLLFRNQPQWDSAEYPGVDAQAGLMQMARILGLSEAQAQACMNSTAHDAQINKTAQDGSARYAIDHTPTFIIDSRKADSIRQQSWEEVQAALDAALSAKDKK
jgi:protein-disulfide isomerase